MPLPIETKQMFFLGKMIRCDGPATVKRDGYLHGVVECRNNPALTPSQLTIRGRPPLVPCSHPLAKIIFVCGSHRDLRGSHTEKGTYKLLGST